MRSGAVEHIPYSLSRWTDVPAAKWPWFQAQMAAKQMVAVDPRNAIPYRWSLRPEDTHGLVFWTKDPTNLIHKAPWLRDYRFKIHVTVTGWHEVERGAPSGPEGARLLAETAEKYGPERVEWRFSPVPILRDVVSRFDEIASIVTKAGIDRVYLSFLQQNDLMPEPRTAVERRALLLELAEHADKFKVKILLCNEDRLLAEPGETHRNLGSGICAPPEDFGGQGQEKGPSEGCGCILMADPFTINESCTMGCRYCYAADKSFAPKKMETTHHRGLPVIP